MLQWAKFGRYSVRNLHKGSRIAIAGQHSKAVTQASLRRAIGIVPQNNILSLTTPLNTTLPAAALVRVGMR